ncbi:hypothetical protein VTI74DRAFT_1289 [Chaetomium olivicolor]
MEIGRAPSSTGSPQRPWLRVSTPSAGNSETRSFQVSQALGHPGNAMQRAVARCHHTPPPPLRRPPAGRCLSIQVQGKIEPKALRCVHAPVRASSRLRWLSETANGRNSRSLPGPTDLRRSRKRPPPRRRGVHTRPLTRLVIRPHLAIEPPVFARNPWYLPKQPAHRVIVGLS